MCKLKEERDSMKKLSLFAILVLGYIGTVSAKHSLGIRNNSTKPATAAVINNVSQAVERTITINPASSARLKLDETQDVLITSSSKSKTIKALKNIMVTGRDGNRRPMMQGISATIEPNGTISSAMFME